MYANIIVLFLYIIMRYFNIVIPVRFSSFLSLIFFTLCLPSLWYLLNEFIVLMLEYHRKRWNVIYFSLRLFKIPLSFLLHFIFICGRINTLKELYKYNQYNLSCFVHYIFAAYSAVCYLKKGLYQFAPPDVAWGISIVLLPQVGTKGFFYALFSSFFGEILWHLAGKTFLTRRAPPAPYSSSSQGRT